MEQKLNTIKLRTPIIRGKQTINEVQIRKPLAGDLRQLKLLDVMQSDVDSYATLLPRITTPALIKEEVYRLELMDIASFAEGIANFLDVDSSPTA